MSSAPSEDGATQFLRGWRYRAVVWSVLLSAVGYLAFALWTGGGWHSVANAVDDLGLAGVVVILCLSLINIGLRFVRWQIYLRELGYRVQSWPSCRIYVAGFALTTTPGKIGEALRSVLLKPRGVPYSASLTAMLSERISDVVAILLLALAGLTVYPRAQPLVAVGAAGVVGLILVLSSHKLLERFRTAIRGTGRISQLSRHLATVLLKARLCHVPRVLVLATVLSVVAWAAEAWGFYLVLSWLGVSVSPLLAMSFFAISMLAGALSFMPGGLGGAEATMIALLTLVGVATTDAIVATVLIRIATLWFVVGLGALFLIRLPRTED